MSELASELGGISFAWRGKAYTAQFLTRFIFRHRVEGGSVRFEDTGATLHHSAFEALCASGPYPCSAEEGKSCSEQAGLARRGRTFRDARRGRWRDDSSGACRPSGR